jgi:TubC N-terminal docking domain
MTLAALIAALDARGVGLSARLVVDAPAGVLTPELREALAEHKPLLLQRVTREMVWGELATWRWGPAVGDPTAGVVVP